MLNRICGWFFVLDLDGDTEEVFDAIPRLVEETVLYDVQVTVPTAFPGTPLYQRLLHSGPLLKPRHWRKCTLFDVNFRSLGMTPERLEVIFRELVAGLYGKEAVSARYRRTVSAYGKKYRDAHLQLCEV